MESRADPVFVILLELQQPRDGIEMGLGIDNMMVLFAQQDQVAETIALAQGKRVMSARSVRAAGDDMGDSESTTESSNAVSGCTRDRGQPGKRSGSGELEEFPLIGLRDGESSYDVRRAVGGNSVASFQGVTKNTT